MGLFLPLKSPLLRLPLLSTPLPSGMQSPYEEHKESVPAKAHILKSLASRGLATCIGVYLLSTAPAAFAAESRANTWNCLLGGCKQELARCLTDPACAAHALCLETCKPDDMECQVRCGDIFRNDVVSEFNSCVVTKHRCIIKKPDDGKFPMPPDCSLVPSFDLSDFTGEWYITSGLNTIFDTFDCQVHHFSASPGVLTGNLTWRVSLPMGGFVTRNDVQRFVQDKERPGHLMNHDNEYLNYKDDWFIVSAKFEGKADDYVFIYYRGSNDAWEGYGGAVVYTRSAQLPDSIVPRLTQDAAKIGLDFDKFSKTNNTCKPQPSFLAYLK